MSADERKIAERMLMGELKELQEEKWVVAEVCCFPRDRARPPPADMLRSRETVIYLCGTSRSWS